MDREQLLAALNFARMGDCIVVWKLDRLARSLAQLIKVVADLDTKGIGLKSGSESIDTTTPGGKLIFHIFGALAEFERSIVSERTIAGLNAAKQIGRVETRPKALPNATFKQPKCL